MELFEALFLVPQPLTFTEAGHVCSKLAGAPASYTSEAEFSDLLRFLSLASNMRASACLDPQEDGSTGVQVSAANRLISEVVQSRRRPLLGPSPG